MSAAARSKPAVEESPASEQRTSVPGDIDPIRAAMARAPEVEWLTPEQRAECDQALEDVRTGRAKLVSHEEMFEDFADRE